MRELPHTHSCFVCGESNPAGLRLRMCTDGLLVRTIWTPQPHHVGFKGTVHGGIISTLLDEMMVWACAVSTRQFAYCAELNVRFLQPATVGSPLQVSAEMTVNRKGRIFEATSALRDDRDTVVATGWGKYLPIKKAALSEILDDVIGDLGEVVDTPS